MESLKELYCIGKGPSSSHTMGPERLAKSVKETYGSDWKYSVVLYGSLAMTGKGHGTDRVLKQVLGDDTEIVFDCKTKNIPHPNTLDIKVIKDDKVIDVVRGMSVGGGKIVKECQSSNNSNEVYEINSFDELKAHLHKTNGRIFEYVYQKEPYIKEYLKNLIIYISALLKMRRRKPGKEDLFMLILWRLQNKMPITE